MDKSQWIIVRNTHEGIVIQEEFDRAAANMRDVVQGKKKNPSTKKNFSVIVCPHCGLTLRPRKREDRLEYQKWYCGHYHTEKKIDRVEIMFENVAEF